MPNHVTHQLTIEGIDTTRIIDQLAGNASRIDFNRVVPMPEELNVEWNSDGFMGLAAVSGQSDAFSMHIWLKKLGLSSAWELSSYLERERPDAIELGRKYLRNREKFGHPTWYEWCTANWGTKWNAFSASTWEMLPDGAVIYFHTAWSPAIPVISCLSEMFTTTAMTLRYFDEGWSFAGEAFFGSGLLEDSSFYPDEDDPRTLEIYRKVYGADFVPNVGDD
jgi:hypothetical protein